LKDLTSS